jgi:hypothetical protein
MSSFFSIPVSTNVRTVPANYVPPDDMQGLMEAVPQFIDIEMNDIGANVTMNATGAGADLNGLFIWRLDQRNLPPRVMTGYRGGFWQFYTGKPTELRMFMGYPSGYFDGSGRGIEYSGWEGWAISNGQNGTINLENFFIIPGYRNDGNSWIAKVFSADAFYGIPSSKAQAAAGVTPVSAGLIDFVDINANQREFVINLNNFPSFGLWVNATDFFKFTKSGSGENWTAVAPEAAAGSGHNSTNWVYPIDQWQIMYQMPISRLPPYVAVGFVQFVGYL